MSLLDTASLIVTPNAYKEGKLYSVIPSDGSGDLSVTRATTATRVNSAGLVELVPYNLLTYSEQFDSASWSKLRLNVSGTPPWVNIGVSPDGTLTSEKIIANTQNNLHSVYLGSTSTVTATTYTLSCFAKQSGVQYLIMYTNLDSSRRVNFDLANGVTSYVGPNILSTNIEDYGNGWYRCSLTFTSNVNNFRLDIGLGTNTDFTFVGNDIDGVEIWGAQLVEGTSALDYFATETRLNIPRLDYSLGSCPSILVEPQRTNLVPNPFAYTGSQVAFNTGVVDSPISGGLSTRITKNEAAGTLRYAIQTCSATALSSSTAYTLSAFFKYDGYNVQTSMEFNTPSQWGGTSWRQLIDVASTGVTLGTSSACTSTIENYGNGWYRVNVTITTGVTILGIPPVSYLIRVASSLSTGQGFLHTAAQLEAGSYATSYIPTTTASVTRNADQISLGNLQSNGILGSTGLTYFMEFSKKNLPSAAAYPRIGNASGNDVIGISTSSTQLLSSVRVAGGGFLNTPILSPYNNEMVKVAFSLNGTTLKVFVNGALVQTTTASSSSIYDRLDAATSLDKEQRYNLIALWATPLTDAECTQLTTL